MRKKLLKGIIYLLVLIISPMLVAALAGAVFLAVRLANGDSFTAGTQALVTLVNDLLPSLPLITGIPAVLIVVAWIGKNKSRIQSRFRKE